MSAQPADAVREGQECWFCPRPLGDPTKAKVYMVRKMRDTFAVLVHPECYPALIDGPGSSQWAAECEEFGCHDDGAP
jgi:hypothetical protein